MPRDRSDLFAGERRGVWLIAPLEPCSLPTAVFVSLRDDGWIVHYGGLEMRHEAEWIEVNEASDIERLLAAGHYTKYFDGEDNDAESPAAVAWREEIERQAADAGVAISTSVRVSYDEYPLCGSAFLEPRERRDRIWEQLIKRDLCATANNWTGQWGHTVVGERLGLRWAGACHRCGLRVYLDSEPEPAIVDFDDRFTSLCPVDSVFRVEQPWKSGGEEPVVVLQQERFERALAQRADRSVYG